MIEFLKNQINRIKDNSFVSSVLTLSSGVALGQIISLITTPIVSRIYDETAFGQNTILVSTATIVCTISQAGLASAIMIPKEKEESKEVFMTAFWFQFLFSSLYIIVLSLLASSYKVFDIGIPYFWQLALLYLFIIVNNVQGLLRIYINREKGYKILFTNSIILAMATLLITIPIGLYKATGVGMIIASVMAYCACIVQMIKRNNPFMRISFSRAIEIIKKYKDFILFQFPSNFISTLAVQLPNQWLGNVYGNSSLGSFAMCEKICGIPSRLIASPVNQVYFQKASSMRDEKEQLSDFTFSLIKKIMLIGLVPISLLILCGSDLFIFVLGEKWGDAGYLSSILALSYLLTFCGTCTSYCRVSLNMQKLNLICSIAQLGIIFAFLLLGTGNGKTLVDTITFFSIGNCIMQVLDMFMNFVCLKKNSVSYLIFSCAYSAVVVGLFFAKMIL